MSSRLCESILEDNFFIYYQVRCIPLTWRSSKIGTDHKLQSSKISSEILVSTDRTSTGKFFFILPAGRVKRLKQDLKFSEALNNLFVSSVQMDTASKIIIYTQMCQLFYLQGRRYKLSIAWVQLDLILNYLIPKYASKSRVQTIFLKTYCFIGLRLYTCQLSQQWFILVHLASMHLHQNLAVTVWVDGLESWFSTWPQKPMPNLIRFHI